jgi:hypothetical protein
VRRRMAFVLSAVAAVPAIASGPSRAEVVCDDGYRLCMSYCTTEPAAERCMQWCQDAKFQCASSRAFKMPSGFSLKPGMLTGTNSAVSDSPASRGSMLKRRAP